MFLLFQKYNTSVLALLHLKHHLWSCTHMWTHREIREKTTPTQPVPAHTTTHKCTHEMSAGGAHWQWPCHNLSLIIYTARLTVSKLRPEKIQPANLICTQQPEPAGWAQERRGWRNIRRVEAGVGEKKDCHHYLLVILLCFYFKPLCWVISNALNYNFE